MKCIQRNQLSYTDKFRPPIELVGYKENIFFQKEYDIRILFQNENGIINKITVIENSDTKRAIKS